MCAISTKPHGRAFCQKVEPCAFVRCAAGTICVQVKSSAQCAAEDLCKRGPRNDPAGTPTRHDKCAKKGRECAPNGKGGTSCVAPDVCKQHTCPEAYICKERGGLPTCATPADAEAPSDPRPHIVLFVSDDQGYANVGYRNEHVHTPAIDAMARAGVILDRHYSAPWCSPSRTSLLSGRVPIRVNHHAPHPGIKFLSRLLSDTGYRECFAWPLQMG